jgi:hypothetical protein
MSAAKEQLCKQRSFYFQTGTLSWQNWRSTI